MAHKIKKSLKEDQEDLNIAKEDSNRISLSRRIKVNSELLSAREADLVVIKKSSLSASLFHIDSAQSGKKSFADLKAQEAKHLPTAKAEVGTPGITGTADPKALLTKKLNTAKVALTSVKAKVALAQFEVDQHESSLASKVSDILSDEFNGFIDSTHNDNRYNARGNILSTLIGKYNLSRMVSGAALPTTSGPDFVEKRNLQALENDKMAHRILALILVSLDNPKTESYVEGVQSFVAALRAANKNKKIDTAQPDSYLGLDKHRFNLLSLEESDAVMDVVNRVMKLRGGPKYLLHSHSFQNTDLNLSDDVKARLLADSTKLTQLLKGSDILLSVKKEDLKKASAELSLEATRFNPIETREAKLRAAVSGASIQSLEEKFNEGLKSLRAEKIQGLASKTGTELSKELSAIITTSNSTARHYADALRHISDFTMGFSSK